MNHDEVMRQVAELLGGELTPELEEAARRAIQIADEEITNVMRSDDNLYFFSAHKLVRASGDKLKPFDEADEFPEYLDVLDADEVG